MTRIAAVIRPELEGSRLDRALAGLFPDHSRSSLARWIDDARVTVDGIVVTKASHRMMRGQQISINIPAPIPATVVSQDIPLTLLFEDENLVVIDKPAGLVVHPAAGHAEGTLVNALVFHLRDLSGVGGELRPGIVHRLDKETSGVMVIAKNDATHRALTAAWNTAAVRKEYIAVVYGTPSQSKGTIDAPIGRDPRDRKRMSVVANGRAAITDYEVIERLRYTSVLRCRLRTGRTHQIRVHLKHLGHPIIGDPLYSGPQWKGIPDKKLQKVLSSFPRQALHAETLVLPVGTFSAAIPDDMSTLLSSLR